MLKTVKKTSLLLFFVLCTLLQTKAFAQYEIVNAKTVEPDKKDEQIEQEIPTFNDPDLPSYSDDGSLSSLLERKIKAFSQRRKNKKELKNDDDSPVDVETQPETEVTEFVPKSVKQIEKEEEISENNRFKVNADKITYDENDGNVYARGNVEIIAKSQGVTLKADNAVLDKTKQTIQLTDNVKVIKDGVEMKGEYLLVDLNEQNILMDNPVANAYSFEITAQEGYLIANDLQMLNGSIKNTGLQEYSLYSRGFMQFDSFVDTREDRKIYLGDTQTYPEDKKQAYRVDAKEILIRSYKDHNTLTFKSADISYNNHKFVKNSDIEIISDKQNQNIETNTPEIGTLRNFGTYIGYGLVYKLPKGQSLKLMPAFVYGDSNFGVGLIGRHRSPNSMIEAGWATASTDPVIRGDYKFSKNFNLRYGRHAYIPEGFMGARRSGYAVQTEYKKSFYIPDLDVDFSNAVYAGLFSDYKKDHQEKDVFATTRFRYMAEIKKTLLKYENKEQDFLVKFNAVAQTAATLYGSGETHGIVRLGPALATKLRRWESTVGYLLSGEHGDSPFNFDIYRYGKSTFVINEKFNFTDKLGMGFKLNISPLKDNPEKDLLTEAKVFAVVGPRDLKLALSYDFVRDMAHLDFMFLMGSDSSKINFDRLITKDMDGRNEKRDFYKNAQPVKIEDPENI